VPQAAATAWLAKQSFAEQRSQTEFGNELKHKYRNSKQIRIPKSQSLMVHRFVSGFVLRIGFGFRVSGFGF